MIIKIELAEQDLDFIIETLTTESDYHADHGDIDGDDDQVDMACRAVTGRRIAGYLQTAGALAMHRHNLFSNN